MLVAGLFTKVKKSWDSLHGICKYALKGMFAVLLGFLTVFTIVVILSMVNLLFGGVVTLLFAFLMLGALFGVMVYLIEEAYKN